MNTQSQRLAAVRLTSLLILTLVAAMGAPAMGQSWRLASTTGPSARELHAMVYDSARQRVVLFGGNEVFRFGDTWEWNGQSWTRVAVSGPSARSGHAMAYDASRGRVVLFGGSADRLLNDTWEWDGRVWTRRSITGPSPRWGHAMTYDEHRGRVVLFGGMTQSGPAGDTWDWNGSRWTRVADSGPRARLGHTLVYDARLKRSILFGGSSWRSKWYGSYWEYRRDTWEWDGVLWRLKSESGPSAREFHAATYDTVR
ncbi:MAG: hypothetical protein KJZ68_15030, partial [Phycisphaerales bacterium]|nr:hypothetical protein [Phycisphaerales bacterium]